MLEGESRLCPDCFRSANIVIFSQISFVLPIVWCSGCFCVLFLTFIRLSISFLCFCGCWFGEMSALGQKLLFMFNSIVFENFFGKKFGGKEKSVYLCTRFRDGGLGE